MPEPLMPIKDQEKFKVVILIGDKITYESKIIDYIQVRKLKGVKLISGKMSNIELSPLQGMTDENTMFIIFAHGININEEGKDGNNQFHHIDDIKTGEFFNNLKSATGGHKICSILFSCYGGGALKRNEISQGTSLMVMASNKYPSFLINNLQKILKILQWKIEEGFSNQKIYEELPSQYHDTIYYYDGNENKLIRLPIISKFNLDEIKKILSLPSFDSDQSKSIIEILEKSAKKYFSIRGIEKQLNKLPIKLAPEAYYGLIKQLEKNLREKISPQAIKNFIKNRNIGEAKKEFTIREISNDQVSNYAFNLLKMAVEKYDIDLVRAIIDVYGKSFLNIIDDEGVCILHRATSIGHEEMVVDLIRGGCEVNLQDGTGDTALIVAIRDMKYKIAETLIYLGADVALANKKGVTPLMIAASIYDKDSIRILLEKEKDDSNTEKNHIEALEIAVLKGHDEIVQILVDNKKTPLDNVDNLLDIAKENNFTNIIEILRRASIKEFGKNSELDFKIMHQAIDDNDINFICDIILLKGPNVITITDEQGHTLLMIAASEGREEIVKILIAGGADLDAQSHDGTKVLKFANKHEGIIKMIMLAQKNKAPKNPQKAQLDESKNEKLSKLKVPKTSAKSVMATIMAIKEKHNKDIF